MLIGIFKLAKSVILVSLGLAVAFAHRDAAAHLRYLGHAVGASPAFVDRAVARIARVDPRRLAELGVGALTYGALFAIEGIGLLLRRLWAEYVTIAITSSFIPFEVYEMVEHGSIAKAIVILLNIAIVGYLIWKLRRDEHWPFALDSLPSIFPK